MYLRNNLGMPHEDFLYYQQKQVQPLSWILLLIALLGRIHL